MVLRRLLSLAIALVSIASLISTEARAVLPTCAQGGVCRVGNFGPAGGRIVYDAGSLQRWGRYLEAISVPSGAGRRWSLQPTTSLYVNDVTGRAHIDAKGVGYGRINTAAIIAQSGPGNYAASFADSYVRNGYDDWFLPSKDELDAVYRTHAVKGVPRIVKAAYWTSSENSANYAWYQMFQDGTQFTDESGVGAITGIKQLTRNRLHRGSGWPSLPFQLMAMRSFPAGTGVPPAQSNPVLTGNTCTNTGPCVVGDIGPGGGVVFYDAGVRKAWGQYMEAAPVEVEGVGLPWKRLSAVDRRTPVYRDSKGQPARIKRVRSKAIGMGQINTAAIVRAYGRGRYAARYADAMVLNGYNDWFLPSKDELNVMYSILSTAYPRIGSYARSFYWSSSEYDFNNAWTVNFKDGQQFDREKWLLPDALNGVKALRVRPVRAFG
jgi:hypothetical protein